MMIRIYILCLLMGIVVGLHGQDLPVMVPDSYPQYPGNFMSYKGTYLGKTLLNISWDFSPSRYSGTGKINGLSYLLAIDSLYEFKSPQDSLPVMKREQRFSENGALVLLKEFVWNTLTSGWIPKRRQVYNYDMSGRKKFLFTFEWNDGFSQWLKYAKDSLVYDDPNTQSDYYMEWNNNEWVFVRKFIQQLDDLKNLTLYAHYDFDTLSNEWYGCCKNEYYYSGEGNMIQELQYTWDTNLNDFILWGKMESAYYESGELMESIRFLLNEESGEWIFWEKRVFSYYSDGSYTMDYFLWDVISQQWILKISSDYFRNEAGDFLGMESFDYDEDTEVPVSGFKFDYVLNDQGLLMLETDYEWDVENEEWSVIRKYFHQYGNPVITDLNDPKNEEIEIYPNPTNTYIFITGSTKTEQVSIQIYTTQGNLILERSFGNEMMDISTLSPGLYLLQLNRPGKSPIIKPLIKN